MKKFFLIVSLALAVNSVFAAAPKYIFYFIGDGMGANQVLLTEMYLSSMKGELGTTPLCFTQFPVSNVSTHFSFDSDVTDSAASGTALATGNKTKNSRIGVDAEGNPLKTVAEMAKEHGKKVGIVTNCALNDATPAAFSAHQQNRGMGYEILKDMIANGFDFYAGDRMRNEARTYDKKEAAPIRPQFEAAGYTICDYEQFKAGYKGMDKVLMQPSEGQTVPYSIDRVNDLPENQGKYLTFPQMVESAITFLSKDEKKGFFLMAEGGNIDHACHSYDGATVIQDILDFEEGIKLALDFYYKHPKQTLIVITADHETGHLTFAPNTVNDLPRLSLQKHSMNHISEMMKQTMVERQSIISWEETKEFLSGELGLWDKVKVSWEDEKMLRDIYESTIAKRDAGSAKDLYSDNSKIVAAAVGVLNRSARVYWRGSHSACYTPVYAIGPGSELFTHRTDNAEVARLVMKAAGF